MKKIVFIKDFFRNHARDKAGVKNLPPCVVDTGPLVYRIPCEWKQYGYLDIEAESLQEAVDIANHPEQPLPHEQNSSYVEGSFIVCEEDLAYFQDFWRSK